MTGKTGTARRRVAVLILLLLAGFPGGPVGCWQEETHPPSIKIGTILPLSGDRSSYGRGAMNGILAAVERINRSGGLDGCRIDLVVVDNRSRPDETLKAIAELDKEGVLAVVGPLASRNALAASRAMQERGIPLVLPAATLTGATRAGEYVSRICFTNRFQARSAAQFAREFLRARTFALVTEAGSHYSQELAGFFQEAAEEAGGQVLWKEEYRRGQNRFENLLDSLRSSPVDAVFLPGYSGEVRTFLLQAREAGLEIPVLGADGWDVPAVAVSPGGGSPGNYFVAHFASDEPEEAVADFVDLYRRKYGYRPHSLAALAYDALSVVADAWVRASGDTREDLKNAINSTRGFRGLTGTLSLDARRDGVKSAVILKTTLHGFEFIERIHPPATGDEDSTAVEVPSGLL